MKKVEGVDLSVLIEQASVELRMQDETLVKEKVKSLIVKLVGANEEVKKAEKALEKAQKAVEKYQARLDKVKTGDWSALEEQKEN
jgi:hypothetical protein